MTEFATGDRVEIVGGIADEFHSKVGVVTAVHEDGMHPSKFTVRLPDGTEHDFPDFQLRISPAIFADMILDTQVSPAHPGLRGSGSSTDVRHMRFVSREFDIHLKLGGSPEQKTLLGHITGDTGVPRASLVLLVAGGKPVASTTTDTLGEFNLDSIPPGTVTLEILSPLRRIVASFDCER